MASRYVAFKADLTSLTLMLMLKARLMVDLMQKRTLFPTSKSVACRQEIKIILNLDPHSSRRLH
jgi:hypothetical protein